MRILVLAHGDGRRWVNEATGRPYLGAPKHFVRIDGETLLERAVRLFRARGDEVLVIGPDDRYDVPGARRVALDGINECGSDMGKFLDTRHLWSDIDRTVIVWGDVYYSDDAAGIILDHRSDDYHVFRRPFRSRITGHEWDESFAVSFGPHEHDRIATVAAHLAELVRSEQIRATHIRTHLVAMNGVDPVWLDRMRPTAQLRLTAQLPGQTHIDDWTDDFDSPTEWRSWIGRMYAHQHQVAVCIPWRDEGDPARRAAYEFVAAHWAKIGVPVFYGDPGPGAWVNRSRGRNSAVAAATATMDWDAVFVADADTYVDADQFWAAVHLAVHTGQLIRSWTEYHKLGATTTRRVLRGMSSMQARRLPKAVRTMRNHSSGALAISRSLWDTVGGYDERFASWGGEDRAFWLACNTLTGWPDDIHGHAWHLWHPTSPERNKDLPQYQANVALAMRYKVAAGVVAQTGIVPEVSFTPVTAPDHDAIRRILAESGGPLARATV